ncbi:nucleoid occlusion factor SlmA [Porticoccus sp. W117]|uniref:nucleoid occlusion factor SlmA n=1 Tax=Porticoccus sp. W117 TaxID=3054777 RepID=UPI002591308B|nr:nucleoid occlusion factor SlmA [Porticoccus sp. W117]MDM3870538.1 nucleoid occlusion factor SlmA [Porticoccus sp. W117]
MNSAETDKAIPRRQQILQALARMLESAPGARITTAALAREVGVSEAALYRHFPSKTKMYEGLIDFIEETLFTRISRILAEEHNAENRCQRILSLVLTFSERNPGITRILNGDALTGETERLHTRVVQLFDRMETQIKQILREAEVTQGIRTRLPTGSSANLMLALAEGRISQFVRSGFKKLPTEGWQDQWSLVTQELFSKPF